MTSPERDQVPARRSRRWRPSLDRVRDVAYPAVAVGLFLLAWELWVRIGNKPPYIMVPFSDVLRACFENWGTLIHHTLATAKESLYGFALGTAIGIALGFAIASVRLVSKSLLPLIVLWHVIPTIALAPLFLIWFGFGTWTQVLIVANFTFFPVMLNMIIGLRSTQPTQVQLFRSAGAGIVQTFFRLRLPNALPQLFVGLKIASTLAIIGAVVAEFVSASEGLGYYVLLANGSLDTKSMVVGVIYLSVTGIAIFGAVELAERLALPWHISRRQSPAQSR
jgi:NitT/TauT family transport system permease protein